MSSESFKAGKALISRNVSFGAPSRRATSGVSGLFLRASNPSTSRAQPGLSHGRPRCGAPLRPGEAPRFPAAYPGVGAVGLSSQIIARTLVSLRERGPGATGSSSIGVKKLFAPVARRERGGVAQPGHSRGAWSPLRGPALVWRPALKIAGGCGPARAAGPRRAAATVSGGRRGRPLAERAAGRAGARQAVVAIGSFREVWGVGNSVRRARAVLRSSYRRRRR